ncbi:MAG: AAA family ATPase [Methanobrevibacter sp.]|nr:AAA family ATPase [Methanobrevibacter sp.]
MKNYRNNVIVSIDEYYAHILKNISDLEIVNGNRKILQEFCNVLKESEKYLKLVFITGLSKFTKVPVFSTFNNLSEFTFKKNFKAFGFQLEHQNL